MDKLYVIGEVQLSWQEYESVYANGAFKTQYYKTIKEKLQKKYACKLNASKKVDTDGKLTIYLICTKCRGSIRVIASKNEIAIDQPVTFRVIASCEHFKGKDRFIYPYM
jgi:RecJ-like exonuclease